MSRARQLLAGAVTAAALVTVTPAPAQASTGSQAVHIAAQQAGKPFVYGASGPWAFDCSGLVSYVYRRLGHRLPHNAEAIYWQTRHISRGSMRPGDIIFLSRRGHIYHSGIYAGHGRWWGSWHRGTRVSRHHVPGRFLVGRVR